MFVYSLCSDSIAPANRATMPGVVSLPPSHILPRRESVVMACGFARASVSSGRWNSGCAQVDAQREVNDLTRAEAQDRPYSHNDDQEHSADGMQLATASTDGTVKLWDLGTGKEICTLRGRAYGFGDCRLGYNRDGTRLVSVGVDGIRMWDTATKRIVPTFKGHQEYLRAVAFRPAGQRIAILNDDSIMQTIDPTNGNVDRTFAGHAESRIAYSPDGKFMVSGGEENTVQLWDADSGKLLRTLTGHTDSVFAAAFSPDGRDRN